MQEAGGKRYLACMHAASPVSPAFPPPRVSAACAQRNRPLAAGVVRLVAGVLLVALCAGCRAVPAGRLLFCESITPDNQPVGAAETFSPGTVSMLVSFDAPVGHEALVVHIDRLEGARRVPYGGEVHLRVASDAMVLRLDNVASFADAGEYVVQIRTRERVTVAEAHITIVAAQ